jgi:hypothetical protein
VNVGEGVELIRQGGRSPPERRDESHPPPGRWSGPKGEY